MDNAYDRYDTVRREAVIIADGVGSLKLAAYKVRDPETGIYGLLQFHVTYDNIVLCLMGEEVAKLFARFVNDTLA